MENESLNPEIHRILESAKKRSVTTEQEKGRCDNCEKIDVISFMHERYKHLEDDTRVLCWWCYSVENMNTQYNLFKKAGLIK